MRAFSWLPFARAFGLPWRSCSTLKTPPSIQESSTVSTGTVRLSDSDCAQAITAS